ncbi:hypothetical protein BJY01DRAFT_227939 [Aspergillus pseudoustus]|uniref:Uncharacterized protein n=1 Tax=Aspergillus pseudoustus TaxID=1810923 RepID=A0ABR4IR51_9EURO
MFKMAPSIDYPTSLPVSVPLSHSIPQKQNTIDVSVVEIIEEDSDNGQSSDEGHFFSHQDVLDPLHAERARLRNHLGLPANEGAPIPEQPRIQPLFFIERVPDSRSITCSLPGCTKGALQPGELRLALNPGMVGDMWFRSSSDYYHVPCFERLADFTSPAYLDRIQPLTRNTFKLRGLKPSSVFDGSYLLPGGIERLILEWKVTRGKSIDKRDGVYDERMYKLDESVYELLYHAGSRRYRPVCRPGLLDQFEFYTLSKTLAPNECGSGNGHGEEWNLFEAFLEEGEGDGVHDLSAMLGRWQNAVALSWQDTMKPPSNDFSCEGEDQSVLHPTAVRAIRRLSVIPVPQVGFNRLSCYP